jgi:hypothetical protein
MYGLKTMTVLVAVFLMLFSGCETGSNPNVSGDGMFKGKISKLIVDGSDIDPDLTGPEKGGRIIVDDMSKPSGLPMSPQMFIDQGVVSMATCDYRSKSNLLLNVNLKIFVFDTQDSAKTFCETRYLAPELSKYHDKLSDWPKLTLQSTQMNKRIVCERNIVISAGTIEEGDAPIKVIDKYLEQM